MASSRASNALVRVGSASEIAARIGCSVSAIEGYRRGKLPIRPIRDRIQEAYDIPIGDWLIAEERIKGRPGGRVQLPPGVCVGPHPQGGWSVRIETTDGPVIYRSLAPTHDAAVRGAARTAEAGVVPHTFTPVFGQDLTAARRKFAPQGFALDRRQYVL